jgi:1-acyl-sn-glycerol-3-phosphate acyltransferase
MLILLPGLVLPFLFGNRLSWLGYKFLALWSWIFSQLTFIRYKVYGREKIKRGNAYIFVSNHTSFLDIPGMCLTIPGEFRPLAKKELLKIPIFGWITQGAAVIVDRSSGESRKKSMDKLKWTLSHGIPLLIFAEGTQNRTKEVIQPFKDGAFRIALDTEQPILPLVVLGAGSLMPPSRLTFKPGTIRIFVGDEIETKNFKDIHSLKQVTFDQMKGTILNNKL